MYNMAAPTERGIEMSVPSNILIIDDEPTLRQTLGRILRQAGFAVTTAEDGEEGLAFLKTNGFDLVYLDIRMPGLSGLEVLDLIHSSHPNLPIILFTAQPDLNSAVEALRRGARDYLLKPLKPDAIIERTKKILAVQQRMQRRRELQEQIESLQAKLKEMDEEDSGQTVTPRMLPVTDRFLKRGVLVLDLLARRLTVNERVVNLPSTSFDYLLVLARHAPEVVGYQTLVAEAQGFQAGPRESQELVKWHIHHIRQAIEPDPRNPTYIFNIRGIGYRLLAD
jgi:two-component system, OmpR family, alkaline phosphatase synthesis response regulator PhoP